LWLWLVRSDAVFASDAHKRKICADRWLQNRMKLCRSQNNGSKN
jgi:hypothetical protein